MSDITARGLAEIGPAARRARRHLDVGTDLVLRDLADLFRKGEGEVFASHGAAIGNTWPALKPSTAKSRARLIRKFGLQITPTAPPLVLFGDLRDAFRMKGGAQHQFVGEFTVEVSIDQAAVNRHNRSTGQGMGLTKTGKRRKARGKGGRYPDNIVDIHEQGLGHAPKRPMIGIPPGIEREMDDRVDRFLTQTLKNLDLDVV